MKNKKFFTLLFIEILVVLAVIGYFFVDSADLYKLLNGDTKFYNQTQECDLHVKACSAKLPEIGQVSFDVEPKSIPLMEPLTFTVTLQSDKDELNLHIFATNMNMGYYDIRLKKVSKNTYKVTQILPTCSVGGMIWRAEVVVGSVGGVFTFKTK